MENKVYVQNSLTLNLDPDYLGPFTVLNVHDSHNYTILHAFGNWKRLYHDCLLLCSVWATQRQIIAVIPAYQHLFISLDAKPGNITNPGVANAPTTSSDGGVATFQVASDNMSWDGTTEPLLEAS